MIYRGEFVVPDAKQMDEAKFDEERVEFMRRLSGGIDAVKYANVVLGVSRATYSKMALTPYSVHTVATFLHRVLQIQCVLAVRVFLDLHDNEFQLVPVGTSSIDATGCF